VPALSRFFLGAVILSDSVLEVVRRELRRLSPGVKIEVDEIKSVLMQNVIKREVIEGEKADEAGKQFNKAANRALRAKASKAAAEEEPHDGVEVAAVVIQKVKTPSVKPEG
jgi:hypothetical protein